MFVYTLGTIFEIAIVSLFLLLMIAYYLHSKAKKLLRKFKDWYGRY